MNAYWLRIVIPVLLALVAVAGQARTALTQPGGAPPVPDALLRLAEGEEVRSLPPGEYRVQVFYFGPDRQPVVDTVPAAGIFAWQGRVYVQERAGARWFAGSLSAENPGQVDCSTIFPSLDALIRAHAFPPLPAAPAGLRLREVVRMPDFPVRLASDGRGRALYVLCVNGDVYRLTLSDSRLLKVLEGDAYHTVGALERQALGLMLDGEGRLYIATNERLPRVPRRNQVTVFRAQSRRDGPVETPAAWLREWYPWGIGAFNHGINHMAIGPDGMLYISSGSRTNGNEPGDDPLYSTVGETPITACLWRVDPRAQRPQIEVFARGLRNAFGFCWNDRGEMFCTDNGPDAHAPEELNQLLPGRHYGFPHQFADWNEKPYPYTPDPPPGVTFERPIPNLGPAAGGSPDRPIYSFDPHSSPGGIAYLGRDWPRPWRGGYFITRFGNLLELPRDVGLDLLHATLTRDTSGRYQARIATVLAPLARPVDLHLAGKGQAYILEYSRQTRNQGFSGNLPGRVLELSVAEQ